MGSQTIRHQIVLTPDDEGDVIATVPALRGCIHHADTYEGALANILQAIRDWEEADDERGVESSGQA